MITQLELAERSRPGIGANRGFGSELVTRFSALTGAGSSAGRR